ncbi:hypothetical protein Hanom_Chr15g01342041 [Helianthus anomalus]
MLGVVRTNGFKQIVNSEKNTLLSGVGPDRRMRWCHLRSANHRHHWRHNHRHETLSLSSCASTHHHQITVKSIPSLSLSLSLSLQSFYRSLSLYISISLIKGRRVSRLMVSPKILFELKICSSL